MGILHTSFESGVMLTAGSDYGDTGTSGLNEFTNRINVESGILGGVSGAVVSHTHDGVTTTALGRPTVYSAATYSMGSPNGTETTIVSGVITTVGAGSIVIAAGTMLRYTAGYSTTNQFKLQVNDTDVTTAVTMYLDGATVGPPRTSHNIAINWIGSVAAGAQVVRLYALLGSEQSYSSGNAVSHISAFELL